MTFNSVSDTTQSESSQVSSVDSHSETQRDETDRPQHPRLAGLRKLARLDAEQKHKVVENRKLRKTKDKRGKIKKTKRQASNIKSAEICRAAKGIYIKRLEDEILKEEEVYLEMMKDMFDQVAEHVRFKQRIALLEEQISIREAQKTWKGAMHEDAADDMVDDFFLVSGTNTTPMQWDHEDEGCTEEWNVVPEIEVCDEDEDEWMDFMVANAPTTPPPPVEVEIPCTPQKKKQYVVTKDLLRSPVALFDLEQALDEESFGLRQRPNMSITVCNE